jgi:DNA-binding HxlR family transcriptional regulator
LTANTVNGSRNGARSGAQTLALLGAPANVLILEALADGPKPQSELRRDVGSPAQTTLRAHLKALAQIGALERHRRNRFPGALECELTAAGKELLPVLDVLRRWLAGAPGGSLEPGDRAARAAIKALADGWSATMLRALAATSLSLTELDRLISSLSYPSLERRLATMRLAGLVEPRPPNGRGTPYAITEWQRLGVAPLAAAARWESRNLVPHAPPIAPLDIEAAFLLAVPRLRLPGERSGSCRLAAEIRHGRSRRLGGVTVAIGPDGKIGSCTTSLDGTADAWAFGSPAAWLSAVIDNDLSGLELGGVRSLGRALVEGLHDSLFGTPVQIHP